MQNNKSAVGAIIVAAGRGTRMGLGYNKMFADLCGRPVIDWTVQKFVDSGLIDEIVLVINADEENTMNDICLSYKDKVRISTVLGGARRQDSVHNGIKALSQHVEIVLIHDGARPFIDNYIIESCILGARKLGAVCTGIRARDTIKIVDSSSKVLSTPDRSTLWHAHTPQAFKASIILEVYNCAIENNLEGTDDASLAELAGIEVTMVEGSEKNIKLTSKEDLELARRFFMS